MLRGKTSSALTFCIQTVTLVKTEAGNNIHLITLEVNLLLGLFSFEYCKVLKDKGLKLVFL